MDTHRSIPISRTLILLRYLRDFYDVPNHPTHTHTSYIPTEVSPFTLHAHKLTQCQDIEEILAYECVFKECISNGQDISSLEPCKRKQIRTNLDALLISYIFNDLKRVCVVANTTLSTYTELLRHLEPLNNIHTPQPLNLDDYTQFFVKKSTTKNEDKPSKITSENVCSKHDMNLKEYYNVCNAFTSFESCPDHHTHFDPACFIQKLAMSAVPSNPPSPHSVALSPKLLGSISAISTKPNIIQTESKYTHIKSNPSLLHTFTKDKNSGVCVVQHKSMSDLSTTPSTSSTSTTSSLLGSNSLWESTQTLKPSNLVENSHSPSPSSDSLPPSPSVSTFVNGLEMYKEKHTLPYQTISSHECVSNHEMEDLLMGYTHTSIHPNDLFYNTQQEDIHTLDNGTLLEPNDFLYSTQHTSNHLFLRPNDFLYTPPTDLSTHSTPAPHSPDHSRHPFIINPKRAVPTPRKRAENHTKNTPNKHTQNKTLDLDNLALQEVPLQGVSYDKIKKRWIAGIRKEQGKYLRKYFSVARFGMEGAKKLAIEARVQYGLPINRKANNNNVHTSVVVLRNKRWIARWQENGRTKAKGFSINEYGEEKAHQFALNCYREMCNKNKCIDDDYQEDGVDVCNNIDVGNNGVKKSDVSTAVNVNNRSRIKRKGARRGNGVKKRTTEKTNTDWGINNDNKIFIQQEHSVCV